MILQTYRHPLENKITVAATFDENVSMFSEMIFREVVSKVAQRYVEENYPELVAKLDQQAIANLAIAESGKKIAEEIKTRPVVLRERTNNYSIF